MKQEPHTFSALRNHPEPFASFAILSGLGSARAKHPQSQLSTITQSHLIACTHPDPLNALQTLIGTHPDDHWIITLSYDLAHTIEAAAPKCTSSFPHIIAHRCSPNDPHTNEPSATHPDAWTIDRSTISMAKPSKYINAVQKALDYISAGDVYQVNIAHPITIPFQGSSSALAKHLFAHTNPALGSFTCFDTSDTRHAIISLSPEIFLTYDPATRRLITEPMKGTRPASADPNELHANLKDRAELNMIIDLMRNDLGRIAVPSTVKVTSHRDIALHHNSVHQATATIQATIRDGLTLSDTLRATFPPGSITGAPKIRAMQIIHELESDLSPHIHRAPYCGSTIALSPSGHYTAAVNIRTLHITGTPDPHSPDGFKDATLIYHAGAGIVADSDPESEWEETLAKAQILESALDIDLRSRS
ncbi:MAG: chorismate-binding protein [Phycisphaerales bacterium]